MVAFLVVGSGLGEPVVEPENGTMVKNMGASPEEEGVKGQSPLIDWLSSGFVGALFLMGLMLITFALIGSVVTLCILTLFQRLSTLLGQINWGRRKSQKNGMGETHSQPLMTGQPEQTLGHLRLIQGSMKTDKKVDDENQG